MSVQSAAVPVTLNAEETMPHLTGQGKEPLNRVMLRYFGLTVLRESTLKKLAL